MITAAVCILGAYILIMFLLTFSEADEPHDWYGNLIDDEDNREGDEE